LAIYFLAKTRHKNYSNWGLLNSIKYLHDYYIIRIYKVIQGQ